MDGASVERQDFVAKARATRTAPPLSREGVIALRAVNEHLVVSNVRQLEAADHAERRRAQLAALLDALNEGVIVLGEGGSVVMANPSARAILWGDPSSSLEPLDAVALQDPDGRRLTEEQNPLCRALRGETFPEAELVVVQPAGGRRRVVFSGSRLESGPAVDMAIVVLRDVTQRHQMEERLELLDRLAAIGTLSAGMAHEINNPLAFVLANVDFTLEQVDQLRKGLPRSTGSGAYVDREVLEEMHHALDEARQGGLRVHRIIADLENFGRVDGGDRTVLSLPDLLERALRIVGVQLRRLAAVRRDYAAAPEVRVNESQLVQVFVNLLMNAVESVDASDHEAGEIVVATFTDEAGAAVAEIRDSGAGVPTSIQRRIFEPFFTTKRVGKGAGLGLSICHAFIEAAGGEITVSSPPGAGAVVRVVLPIASSGGATSSAAEGEVARSEPRRGRILIVDDEEAIGRVIGRVLQREHDVEVLRRPGEALARIARGESFDVVFCDLTVPEMRGEEFAAALKAMRPDLARRLVFLAGGTVTPETRSFVARSQHPVMRKPFDVADLRQLVTALVGAWESDPPSRRRGVDRT
jgi:signal transduction histidine kinase/CheY-like chemotaxis protein